MLKLQSCIDMGDEAGMVYCTEKEKERVKANIPPYGIEQYYSIDTIDTIEPI